MELNLKEVRRVYYDGMHNAFTDIAEYKGKYYLTFRHGLCHGVVEGKGEIYLLSSLDLNHWSLVATFPALADSRDPKLFIFKEKLGVIFFACPDLEDTTRKRAGISYSEDGINFSSPKIIDTDNLCYWRIREYQGKLYLTAYSAEGAVDWASKLFISEDGFNFTYKSTILEGEFADETDLTFLENGSCLALVRREGKIEGMDKPVLAISKPPYLEWKRFPQS